GAEPPLPDVPLPPLDDPELEGQLAAVRQSLHRARQAEADSAEVERLARAFWAAAQGKPGGSAPQPDARLGGAGLFDLFRQTAEALRRYAASLEEANERMATGALDQTETVARTTTTVEALSEKIDRISQNAEDASSASERTRQEARRGLEQVHRVIEGMD